jgi:hypothetical protein
LWQPRSASTDLRDSTGNAALTEQSAEPHDLASFESLQEVREGGRDHATEAHMFERDNSRPE